MLNKTPLFSLGRRESKEQVFNLPLPTLVEGRNAIGKLFREKTVLFYISHQGASFNLSNVITLGSKLKLIIDLPPGLAEDKNLKLVIHGKVALVEANNSHPGKQRISIRFENKYFIKEDA